MRFFQSLGQIDGVGIFHTLFSTTLVLHCLVPCLIGVATVLVSIQANHATRIRRIKLLHGFAQMFSPQARGSASPHCDRKTTPPDSAPRPQADKGSALPRKQRDIRYSPSLEFVVTKYISDLDEKLDANDFKILRNLELFADSDQHIGDILKRVPCFSLATNRHMLVYGAPFMAIVACGFCVAALAAHSMAANFAVHRQPSSAPCVSDLVPLAIVFLSGYLATLTMLVRAVALFDLTVTTFMRALLHIFGAMFTGGLISILVEASSEPWACSVSNRWLLYIALFAVGFVPDAGTRFLLTSLGSLVQSKTPGQDTKGLLGSLSVMLQFLKLTDGRFARNTKSIPLDVIDGIDFFTRYRLEEAGIYEVQNLAVANPILLNVETPFGIYQAIDWVGQAQLCTVVGPQRFLILRQFNIRTVFDLERAVLSLKATSEIRRIIGGILLMTTDTMTAIAKDCNLTFPNMHNPQGNPFTTGDYIKWAVEEALKPSTYRVKLPEPPNPIDPASLYRVFPTHLPGNPARVAAFTVVGEAVLDQNCNQQPNLQNYEVFEFTNAQDATIKHVVRLIMDDLHVMRLRQIWESIARILGGDAATLDDSEDTFLGA